MFHKHRRWRVVCVQSAGELADQLASTTWCGCHGFELEGYWFLNDSTSADAVQEFAVAKMAGPRGTPMQVESLSVSWCTPRDLLGYIERALRGEFDRGDFSHEIEATVQTAADHGKCPLCV